MKFNGRHRACWCTGGCMRDLNAADGPERSGVNGLCVDCHEREVEAAEERRLDERERAVDQVLDAKEDAGEVRS